MAHLKIRHRESCFYTEGKYHDSDALHDVITYIVNPDKTPSGYIGGIAVNPQNAITEMGAVSRYYGQDKGVRLRHFILSFRPRELCPRKSDSMGLAFQIAKGVAQYYGNQHQILYAVHENTRNPHIHFVMNSTNYRTGLKYAGTKGDLHQFIQWINGILEYYGLHVVYLKDDGDWQS